MEKKKLSAFDTSATKVLDISSKKGNEGKFKVAGIIIVLVITTMASYSGIVRNEFVNYDDEVYITNNAIVSKGLTWGGFKWAFTSTYASNWHPLTWLSHMLDVQLFGLKPAGHHLTNLLFHSIALLLLFCFMRSATGRLWPSAFVAALFAVHPLHVESVAWAAERKDVLSAVFGFAALWSYAYYTRFPSIKNYALVIILFAFGLMAKPMLVTLPLILLLFDYWPLERLVINRRCILKLVAEKVPLLAMAIASAIITIIAQRTAIGGFNRIYLPIRAANAIISYCVYIQQTVLPIRLAVFYPYATHPHPVAVAFCALLLITITVSIMWKGRQKKYLVTGWFWYLVTLAPVIGIVQVGSQAHADRYSYLSIIGIFIIVSWGLKEIVERMEHGKKLAVGIASTAVILAISGITWKQVGYWKNDFTLFSHAITVTKGNYTAYNILGFFFERTGRRSDAMAYYQKAIELYPNYVHAHYNLGLLLKDMGRTDEALAHFQKVVDLNPTHTNAHNNLGLLLAKSGRTDEALAHYQKAFECNPDHAKAHNNLGALLEMMGRTDEASDHYRKALEINPNHGEAHNNLGLLLAKMGRTDEALAHFQKALIINPNNGDAQCNLGALLEKTGRTDEALVHYRKALEINPDNCNAHYDLGALLEKMGRIDEAMAHYRKASEINPNHAKAHNSLGALLAQSGRSDEALAHFQKALAINPGYGDAHFNLGFLLEGMGQNSEAIDHFRKAMEITPYSIGILENLAFYLVQNGQLTNATSILRNALISAKTAGEKARATSIAQILAKIRGEKKRTRLSSRVR